jgi:membrane fusion protein (multidrug efflux system)
MPTLTLTKKQKIQAIAAAAAALLLIGGLIWRHEAARWTTTDNAYVQADTAIVSPQVEGFVAEVLVAENQAVAAGQPLVRLDPADARARLAEAEAALAAARAAVRSVGAQASLQTSQVAERAAAVRSAEAEAQLARSDLQRYGVLAERGLVAPQRLQSSRAAADQASAGVSQARAALEAQRRSVSALGTSRAEAEAQVRAAEARLAQAQLAVERTTIVAPVDGVVGDLSARPGEYVRPGAQVMVLVPLGRAYVVANFKETQVGRLRIGQIVEIHADAFPGEAIHGRVESFSPASGSEFALIPVEHASGNFTRITQRVPVRIALDDEPLAAALRPGLSLEVRVDTRSPGGASFVESAVLDPNQLADAAPAPPAEALR